MGALRYLFSRSFWEAQGFHSDPKGVNPHVFPKEVQTPDVGNGAEWPPSDLLTVACGSRVSPGQRL